MDIKPRSTSGHLLSVHGKRDHILLEMVNGTVKFTVRTLKGPIETSFQPTNSMCDGNWHNVRGKKNYEKIKKKNFLFMKIFIFLQPLSKRTPFICRSITSRLHWSPLKIRRVCYRGIQSLWVVIQISARFEAARPGLSTSAVSTIS